ncbi:ABC transporter permease [Spirosoma endbachense]|uniref:FtsX-like permease family protein n=1 Tax=Spirosoma endbachense TaxID=2666025 RepID=A0A6P1VUK3_9BACT|nr:ABC transporter permease [Spirosoma endbachense]QHV95650.1 FtsX-like permease family protein [Spirosoma endbachense]
MIRKRLSPQPERPAPPRWADRLLEGFVAPHLLEYVQGDLQEVFYKRVKQVGLTHARREYGWAVLHCLTPFFHKPLRPVRSTGKLLSKHSQPALMDMLRNYVKIAFRNLAKNKGYSFINISGLAMGMSVTMLIGLWIYDEISFNKYHTNYDRIAQVMQHQTYNGEIETGGAVSPLMAEEIRSNYGNGHSGQYRNGRPAGVGSFKYVVQSSWTEDHILTAGEKIFTKAGNYCDPQIADMLSLKMRYGTRAGLNEPYSILLSETVAKAFFGDVDPVNKILKIDNKQDVKITGVYEDLPYNSTFNDVSFVLPWELYKIQNPWIKEKKEWSDDFTLAYAQIADNTDMAKASAKIKNIKLNKISKEEAKYKPEVFLQPMSKWHLYSEFKNGINTGGRIEFVWLFGIIGLFVLLLACINFMNLATARSEKRAKEVGIRKAIGSFRGQLISQFFSESMLVVSFSFLISLLIVLLILPLFNEISNKRMSFLWVNPIFWFLGIGFSLLTGLIAGLYPALYLSSFQAIKVLKGTFRVGRFATIPRKILVVVQFTVSVTLIIGTIMVFKQIQFARNRPIGYNRSGLITIEMATNDIHNHFDAVRADLLKSTSVEEVSESSSPATGVNNNMSGLEWKGKDPTMKDSFAAIRVTSGYGKTVGWQLKDGRDFSSEFGTDSSSIILNEAAVHYMGLKNPVGEFVRFGNKDHVVVGVIKDMLMSSPYEPIKQTVFYSTNRGFNYLNIKISPNASINEALNKIEAVCKTYSPSVPFAYKFVDDEYDKKFSQEQRIGKLAAFFAILAIFISCLGLFGLASFIAEQRTKEIGIRKVLGASVAHLWQLLSKDFVVLVIASCLISAPIAYYFMSNWLQKYTYRTEISWWIFAASGVGALVITLLTVSFQSIKAALVNPVKSLRSE